MATVRGAGVSVSAAQLERWRQWGLLPRATRAWRGRHGSVSALPEDSVEMAIALGRHARRRRTWVDLAVLAWLDGAPVRDAVLSRALRHGAQRMVETAQELIEKELQAHPVPAGMALDPAFEQAEALARITASGASRPERRLARQMRTRLQAANYEGSENPLRDMLTYAFATPVDAFEPEVAAQWWIALGALEEAPPDTALSACAGAVLMAGLQSLTGLRRDTLFAQDIGSILAGEAALGRQELSLARQDLSTALPLFGIRDEDRLNPTDSPLVAHHVAHFCAVWAMFLRRLPEGTRVREVMHAGLESLGAPVPGRVAMAA